MEPFEPFDLFKATAKTSTTHSCSTQMSIFPSRTSWTMPGTSPTGISGLRSPDT